MRRICILLLAVISVHSGQAHARTLRVCADPNRLPYSNRAGEGFENRIARWLGRELHARLQYTWWPQGRGFLRNTLNAGVCDMMIGAPLGLPGVRSTQPYYRSSFAFVSLASRQLRDLESIDDPRLLELAVGVALAGDDGANPAPAHALAARQATHLVGFPLADAVNASLAALRSGSIDVALLWGPSVPPRPGLAVQLVRETADAGLPFAFPIAMGVRAGDEALASELDTIISRRRGELERILNQAQVPRLEDER